MRLPFQASSDPDKLMGIKKTKRNRLRAVSSNEGIDCAHTCLCEIGAVRVATVRPWTIAVFNRLGLPSLAKMRQ